LESIVECDVVDFVEKLGTVREGGLEFSRIHELTVDVVSMQGSATLALIQTEGEIGLEGHWYVCVEPVGLLNLKLSQLHSAGMHCLGEGLYDTSIVETAKDKH
jgi:hypothetical protein